MRLVDMEKELKCCIEKYGPNNGIVFNKIYELCYEYFRRNKKMNNAVETEETSMILAETLFLKICKGSPIHSWLGYINISAIAAIRKYRKMTSSEIIDISEDPLLEESIISMCSSGLTDTGEADYYNIFDEDFISNIPFLIEEIMDKCCRYYKYTSKWNNLYLFILLNLYNEDGIIYPFIDESEIEYSKLMLSLAKNKLVYNLKLNCENQKLSGRNLIQLFTLSEAVD